MRKDIKVLLVDDHQVVRDGLCAMLAEEPDIEVVSQSAGGEDVLIQIARYSPNVILMDIKMPRLDGIQLTNLVRQKNPNCNIIMLTLYDEYLVRAMGAGARGYLLKDIRRDELIQAIRQVHRGEVVIGNNVAGRSKIKAVQAGEAEAGVMQTEILDKMFEEVQLVIPPPSDANQIIQFISKVENTLRTRIIQVAGSWEEGTVVTAVLPGATRLDQIIGTLREMSGIDTVEHTSLMWGANSGLIDRAVNSMSAKDRPCKVLFINFKDNKAEANAAYRPQ